jgi:hypothetical protein
MTPTGKWMPAEPTEEMALAGRKACCVVADRMETAKMTAFSTVDFWQQVGHQPANEIYRAMYAVAPASPVPGSPWHDIDSAPKDGTRVDLWVRPWDAFANGNPARITDAWFEGSKWKRVLGGWVHDVDDCGEPTHWMPKPAAPGSEAPVPAEVRKVLEPFAAADEYMPADQPDDATALVLYEDSVIKLELTRGTFRAARDLLKRWK